MYEEYGEQGLVPLQRGRTQWKSNDEVLKSLELLLEGTPQSLGYLRSRWSSELLAKVLGERTVSVHLSTHCDRVWTVQPGRDAKVYRSRSERSGLSAKCVFHNRGVSWSMSALGWVATRCKTSVR